MAKKIKVAAKKKKQIRWNENPATKPVGRGLGSGAGKEKIIKTPEELWNYFEQYVAWCKENPFMVHKGYFRGKKVYEERERAVIFIGFEGWMAMNNICNTLGQYRQNIENRYADYIPIIKKIKNYCSMHTVGGALGGVFNANLTARIEGLKEHTDVTTDGEKLKAPPINVYNTAPPMADSEDKIDSKK